MRRNTLALFGLAVLVFFVIVAVYAISQPLPYYAMESYCGTNNSNPTVWETQNNTNDAPEGLPNGAYAYHILPVNGFTPSPTNGSFRIAGTAVIVFIHFSKAPTTIAPPSSLLSPAISGSYDVRFIETGLPPQTDWQVAVNYTSPNLCITGSQQVCTYPAGSAVPGPGCYQTPAGNPSDIAPTLNLAKFSTGPLPLGSLTLNPATSSGFFSIYHGLLRGSDWSLLISTAIVGGGAIVGLVVGAISGFYGGVVDEALMRLVDIFLSIPQILFVIVVIAVITEGNQQVIGLNPPDTHIFLLIMGFLVTWWPFYARVVRGQVLVVREQKYVEAARAAGAGRGRIIRRHIIPNSVYPVFIQMSLDVGTIPLLIGVLIYLGFSLFTSPYFPEWGAISANSVTQLQLFLDTCTQPATGCVIPWWQILFPGLVLFFFAISVNFLSDGLRDALDPRLRR
ncbi:MAG: ABC transporter permease [Thermoplasmata archaeon]|nr:ABC transporter permease [Thermoplasmata archaeon]